MVFRTQCWVRSVSSNRPSSRTTRPRGALVGLFSSSSLGGALLGLIAKSVVVVEKSLDDDDDDDDDDDARFKVSKMWLRKEAKFGFQLLLLLLLLLLLVSVSFLIQVIYVQMPSHDRFPQLIDKHRQRLQDGPYEHLRE